MPELAVGSGTVTVDEFGFMLEPDDWTPEIAEELAKSIALHPLTEDHWRVVRFVREYFEQCKTAPMLRAIIKRTKLTDRRIRTLFPSSCRECICKIAGLPKGTG